MADKDAVFDDISKFDASKLKKTETKEKNTLPTKESKRWILFFRFTHTEAFCDLEVNQQSVQRRKFVSAGSSQANKSIHAPLTKQNGLHFQSSESSSHPLIWFTWSHDGLILAVYKERNS